MKMTNYITDYFTIQICAGYKSHIFEAYYMQRKVVHISSSNNDNNSHNHIPILTCINDRIDSLDTKPKHFAEFRA